MKKTTQKKPRFKQQRKLMTELPGLGKAGALERRPYPPGEHGQRRRKYSEYALQLEEKQKILFGYCLREKQLKRFVEEAKRTATENWVSRLVGLLELRLDNVVFRMGFAPSIPSARQLVSHGKVFVNGQRVNIRSAVVRVGDRVTLKASAYQHQDVMKAKAAPRLPLPDYLAKESATVEGVETEVGIVRDQPNLGHLPFPFNDGSFTSYYSA